jgi:hypothetical protein
MYSCKAILICKLWLLRLVMRQCILQFCSESQTVLLHILSNSPWYMMVSLKSKSQPSNYDSSAVFNSALRQKQ